MGMFLFDFTLVQHEAQIMLAVATDTTISCSLDRQYRLVFSLSFIDVYGLPPQQQQQSEQQQLQQQHQQQLSYYLEFFSEKKLWLLQFLYQLRAL